MCFFSGIKGSNRDALSIEPIVGAESSLFDINTLRKWNFSFLHSVVVLLLVCSQSEIVPPVIGNVEVLVVDRDAFRDFDSHQHESYVMNVEPFFDAVKTEGNAVVAPLAVRSECGSTSDGTGVMLVVSVPFQVPLEMMSWPFLPAENSGFRIVNKRLAEESLEGFHIGSRAFGLHRFSDVSVRRMGADTPIAPPVYPTLTTEATA